jgi:hypothetical protein
LKANIFIQPDAPADLVLLVDPELFSEEVIPLLVDFLVVLLARACINWTEFSIPDLYPISSAPTAIASFRLFLPELCVSA